MGVGSKKRRKDIERAEQGVRLMDYFFDDTFAPVYNFRFGKEEVKTILTQFAVNYDVNDDNSQWFAKVKQVAAQAGFAAEMSEYKANPAAFKGSVADAAEVLRVAVTGSANSPDFCTIMKILGRERTLARINAAVDTL